jgi:sulfite reductase (NADPH) hemoprotein beta-component
MPERNVMSSSPSPLQTRAPFAEGREIDAFVDMLQRYERGEIDADAWRAYRVVRGAYSQRQDGVHMLRIKLPQGVADAAQLRALADVAKRHSRGYGHVTTRQNFQVHFLRPADLEPAMRRLAEAGITTSGSGGNAVRNVVACAFAGVAADEAFDVTPYAEAMTRHFLRHPLASSLPRKFKIAFEGCATDHVATPIHDLGFRARPRVRDGAEARGFRVTVAGGTSSLCTSGSVLFDFLGAGEVLTLAEALVRLFHARGDRTNKQRNRLKFLVRALGLDAFRALLEEEIGRVKASGAPALPFDSSHPPEDSAPAHAHPGAPSPEQLASLVASAPPRGPGEPPCIRVDLAPGPDALAGFVTSNVRPQRQPGWSIVSLALPQGDVSSAQLEAAADLALSYGDGTVRLTGTGKIVFRWVRTTNVPAFHARLAAAGLARDGAGSAADVVACPGADACRQAVTRTRDIARLVEGAVRSLDGAALAAEVPVHVSGCPNGCSQHHVAAIGLQGSARKLGARAVPQYFVLAGGGVGASGAAFGKLVGKVPARRAPEAVRRLVELYLAERADGERAHAYFARALDRAKEVIAPIEELRLEDARPEDYVEPGATDEFRPETQDGECAA